MYTTLSCNLQGSGDFVGLKPELARALQLNEAGQATAETWYLYLDGVIAAEQAKQQLDSSLGEDAVIPAVCRSVRGRFPVDLYIDEQLGKFCPFVVLIVYRFAMFDCYLCIVNVSELTPEQNNGNILDFSFSKCSYWR